MSMNVIEIRIYNVFVSALLDTGASVSVVSEQLIKHLDIPIKPIRKSESKLLTTADGKPINVLGKVLLSIKIRGLTIPFEFLVTRNLAENIILGIDFLQN